MWSSRAVAVVSTGRRSGGRLGGVADCAIRGHMATDTARRAECSLSAISASGRAILEFSIPGIHPQ